MLRVEQATGELLLGREVTFEVRPLDGPGSMGPRVLAASSEALLEELRAYLGAHPDVQSLRIECAANPTMMSGMPTPRWPAGLSIQVARWLVVHGVDCTRLDVVGWLDAAGGSPGERVRFFISHDVQRPAGTEVHLDACSAHE